MSQYHSGRHRISVGGLRTDLICNGCIVTIKHGFLSPSSPQ